MPYTQAVPLLLFGLLPLGFWPLLPANCPPYFIGAPLLACLGLALWFSRWIAAAGECGRQCDFRHLAENSPDNIVRYDRAGRVAYLNATLEKTLGMKAKDLIGKHLGEVHPDRRFDAYLRTLEQVFASGEDGEVEMPLPGGAGGHHVRMLAERGKNGELRGVLAIGRDISECRQVELQLKLKEFALDQTGEAVYLMDEQLRFIYVNEGACRALGYCREELLGLTPADIDPHYTLAAALVVREKTLASGAMVFETWHRRRNGEVFPVEVQTSAFAYHNQCISLALARDISERKNLEAQLRRREQEFRSLVENSPDAIVRYDREARFVYANPKFEALLGVRLEQIIGHSPTQVPGLREAEFFEARVRRAAQTGVPETFEHHIETADGKRAWGLVVITPELDEHGQVAFVQIVSRDIGELKAAAEKLRLREREFRTLVDNVPDNIARYDRDCRRLFINPALAAQLGCEVAALLGKTPSEIPGGAYAENYEQKIRMAFANGETSEFELKWSNHAGREMCSLVRVVAERDASGKIVSVLAMGRDITELHEQRQQMHRLAFYDALTALPNRASFSELLQRRIAEAARHSQLIGVMLLDLDCFKSVNDTLGHSAGDTLLRETALRLGQCVRAYDTLARLGGDEFAILLPAVHARDELNSIADRILEALAPAFMLDNREVFISASIGIALYPEHGKNTDELLKLADVAMYAAKRAGRGNFRFYARELAARNGEKLNLESELRHGLARGELELYYQPKIRLLDGALIGAEALLRWNHPRRGMVLPNTFIPIAEERGLITDIGEWVLRDGCRAAYEWNAPGKPLLKVAVNLSARQFLARNLATHVQRILEETGCPPGWLELEITESLLLEEDGEVRKTLDAFREMGITVAIDDFGTGYSALNYLARFPIDTLKIDRSFISRIGEGEHHAELVKAIILIAHSLKQKVVAEGVETTEQADFLRTQGCHCAQGYLYSQPLSKSAFAALRERANGRAAARAPATAGYLLLAGQDEQNFH